MGAALEQEQDAFQWVEPWLDIWARWMREPDLHLGHPKKSAGFIGGGYGGYRNPADEWEAEGEARAVDIINASLESMSPVESCAIHHVKLCAVFRFERISAEEAYLNARQKVGIRLRAADFS